MGWGVDRIKEILKIGAQILVFAPTWFLALYGPDNMGQWKLSEHNEKHKIKW
jgi:hypothetical protein